LQLRRRLQRRVWLNLDLAAKLDDTIRRYPEELRRRQRVAVHDLEQLTPNPPMRE